MTRCLEDSGIAACAAAPQLTSGEANLARVYFGLLGRVPELDGLNFWLQALGSDPTVNAAAE